MSNDQIDKLANAVAEGWVSRRTDFRAALSRLDNEREIVKVDHGIWTRV